MNTTIMPKRGGMYPIYGLFMGGSELTDDYTLKSATPYTLTTQLRKSKQSSSSERILISARQKSLTAPRRQCHSMARILVTRDKTSFHIANSF